MTTEEAIEILEEVKELDDTMYAYNPVYMNALDMAIKALKEIQLYKDNKLCLVPKDVYSRQCSELDVYKEIGTVEECQEAVDKQKPIKQKGNCFSKGKSGEEQHEIILICPLCGGKALKRGYPCKCGQAIQWDEDLEDIENGT